MKPEYYEAILERLQKEYHLKIDRSEHAAITEFIEGPLPVFKLIMTTEEEEQPSILMISFHIEVDAPSAIQWFMRVRSLDPNLYISACYLKDAEGVSYVGEDAEIMRMYMMEQDIISAWVASDKDAADVLNQKLPTVPPSPIKTYGDYKKALVEFHRMHKKKDDVSH